jgi:hypothetical protein
MRRLTLLLTAAIAALAPIVLAQSTGPYKVLKTAKVGGEGGTDYIYADTVGRRLYITRGATQAREATATIRSGPSLKTLDGHSRGKWMLPGVESGNSFAPEQRCDYVPQEGLEAAACLANTRRYPSGSIPYRCEHRAT